MIKELGFTIVSYISLAVYWWIDDISIVGNVNPVNVQIGEDVILSCLERGCRFPNLQVHLYKWEGSENKTLYIYNSTKQMKVQESNSEEREKNETQQGCYINGLLEVTLLQVKPADAGQYVCALTCGKVYKEDTMEVIPGGIINASVGEDATLPCPLILAHNPSYLKMHWRRISPGKEQTIYSYLYQGTSPVVYSEDTHGDRCNSSNVPSSRVWFGKKYRQKAEIFKSNELSSKNGYMKLKNIQEEDAGKYLCSVKSNLLHKQVTFQLSVKGNQYQDMSGSSTFLSFVLPYLLCLPFLALCLPKNIGQQQADNEELQKLRSEVEELRKLCTEEVGQWQTDKEVLRKLCSEEIEELQKLCIEVQWRRACSNADSVTLDASSAHPNLSITVDKKSFTHEDHTQNLDNPQRFDRIVSVLGSEGFFSGNHYWTVDTGNSTAWDLGVAIRSIQRKGQISLLPIEGFWVLGRSGKDYWAKTDPWTRVTVQRKLSKIGVYLSFQEKEVAFFNIADMSVLFVFKDCSFTEEIFPFFKNTHKGTAMRICSIKEEKA
ncbi:erythroid membrane-associated protein-like isoform X2 [Eublepharis macularius]|uniref:Erythroid membrane-associated protein-like isoform X2 n=1 Tax=Eublepharis macularius TaxID=481883 RepID=A0AA97K5B4_EUBMA|nr:erythroid membrane-associated protein-like isoform X2 [Eublepharis macularius]